MDPSKKTKKQLRDEFFAHAEKVGPFEGTILAAGRPRPVEERKFGPAFEALLARVGDPGTGQLIVGILPKPAAPAKKKPRRRR